MCRRGARARQPCADIHRAARDSTLGAAYMLDSVTPSARHSYWQPQFIDADTFMAFGCVIT